MQKDIEQIVYVGQLVDGLELYLRGLDGKEKNFDTQRILNIESEFDKFDNETEKKDAVAIYHYTFANYKFFLKDLAARNFDLLKKTSKHVKKFKDIEDFLLNNYASRVESFRMAIKSIPEDTKLNKAGISQFYVNLSNLLHEMGRIVESIDILNDADKVVDGFLMATGNLAIKHYTLGNSLTNEIHNMPLAKFFIEKGLDLLSTTLDNATQDTVPLESFEDFRTWEIRMENIIDDLMKDEDAWTKENDVNEPYKVWSAKKGLSLNYVNVIYPYGNVDDIHIPDMGLGYFKNSNNLEYYSWFNTIKQEYNMARYFLYQVDIDKRAIGNEVHESQKYNILINTLDYPSIGYRTELLKSSLREAFGVLDKIGMLCCKFNKVQVKTSSIDFHKWYQSIKLDVALKSPFKPLYWMSKDLDTRSGEMKEIRQLRNYLEHRYIRVLDSYDKPMAEEFEDSTKYEYKVTYSDLKEKAFETLELVRSALFYTVMGFNAEYMTTINNLKDNQKFLPLMTSIYEDEWKD